MTQTKLEMTSAALGMTIEDDFREISWRETMNYAAATGDTNPSYLDDSRAGGVIAPPMYAVAFTWPLVTGQRVPIPPEAQLKPEIAMRGVHATQHLQFHNMIKPGHRIKSELKIVSIEQTRAGVLQTRRVTTFDDQGNKVFTEFSGSMMRGVSCVDGGGQTDVLPTVPQFSSAPANIWSSAVDVAKEAAHVYDGCTDIINPIHTSEAVAKAAELPGIILQGTNTLALAARELVNIEADGNPSQLSELACQFSKMVFPGTTIQVQLTHREFEKDGSKLLGFQVLNGDGEIAVSKGYARIAV